MMNKFLAIIFLVLSTVPAIAQDEQSVGKAIDDLTFRWDNESIPLNSYEGLMKFCSDAEYRNDIIKLLNDIHHYDSVLYQRLVKASHYSHDKEIEKTLEEIKSFEKEYSMKKFLHFLSEECHDEKDIEKHAEELKNDIGMNSYDGQIYIIETELNKYIKHITKRMDNIRDHVDHLHIK